MLKVSSDFDVASLSLLFVAAYNSLGMTWRDIEALIVKATYKKTGHHIGRTAELLNMHRSTVSKKLNESASITENDQSDLPRAIVAQIFIQYPIHEVERSVLGATVLHYGQYNKAEQVLGIDSGTLRRRMKALGLR